MKINIHYSMCRLFILLMIGINVCIAESPKDKADDLARHFIVSLKSGNENEVFAMLIPATRTEAESKFIQLQSLITTVHIDSLRLLDSKKTTWSDGREDTYLLYDAPNDTGWVVVTINIVKNSDAYVIKSFYINPLSQAQYHSNDFSFENKSLLHFIFLLYSVVILIFIVVVIILCVRSDFKRKWLWILGMVFSFPTVTLNWSTAEIGFQLLKFTILGLGFSKYPLIAPWMIQSTVPLISIIFFVKWFMKRNSQLIYPNKETDNSNVAA
jgi:hypothetical protein